MTKARNSVSTANLDGSVSPAKSNPVFTKLLKRIVQYVRAKQYVPTSI